MLKVILICLFIFFLTQPIFAQEVDTAWVRTYDTEPYNYTQSNGIEVDNIGNVYVTGYNHIDMFGDIWVTIKYYPNGDTAWLRTSLQWFQSYRTDRAQAILIDSSGDVYVTGYIHFPYYFDYATVKCYPDGDTGWLRTYNGGSSRYCIDMAVAMALDKQGNIYVTGKSNCSGYPTIKYDASGNEIWVKTYEGGEATAIAIDNLGNIYVTGSDGDYVTIKYKPDGDTAWVRRYNGPGNSYDGANAIAVDGLGNVYVTGHSDSSEISSNYTTIKYYPNGDTAWVRIYSSGGSNEAKAIAIDSSGYVYVTGTSGTIKYDFYGNLLWFGSWGGNDIALDTFGNVYVTGNGFTAKYYPNGDSAWTTQSGGLSMVLGDSGYVYVTGGNYVTIKYWQNYPPNLFSLLSPVNDTVIIITTDSSYVVSYEWESAIDKDPWDTVKYNLYISTSSTFHPDSTDVYNNLLVNQYTDTLKSGEFHWKVRAYDNRGETWSQELWSFICGILGDSNGDKQVNVSDVVYLINYLFKGGPAPVPAPIVGDANCDGKVTVSDVIYLINYLFKGGPPPAC